MIVLVVSNAYLRDMTRQIRQPVGARNDTAAVGGRFAPKTAPDVDDDQISFNNGTVFVANCPAVDLLAWRDPAGSRG